MMRNKPQNQGCQRCRLRKHLIPRNPSTGCVGTPLPSKPSILLANPYLFVIPSCKHLIKLSLIHLYRVTVLFCKELMRYKFPTKYIYYLFTI